MLLAFSSLHFAIRPRILTPHKLTMLPKFNSAFPAIPLASAGIAHGMYFPKLRAEPS